MPPLYPPDLFRELAELKRRLAAVEVAARTAPAKTKIQAGGLEVLGPVNVRDVAEGGGGMRVRDADGVVRSYIGQVYAGGSPVGHGMLLIRPGGGGNLLEAYTDTVGQTRFRVMNEDGQVVFNPDEQSGVGLARPYLHVPMYPLRFASMESTISATFDTVYAGRTPKQHPRIGALIQYGSDASTTGEARMVVNGVQVGPTITIAANIIGLDYLGPAAVAGAHMDDLAIDIQIRRTSGTGTIKAAPVFVRGEQS